MAQGDDTEPERTQRQVRRADKPGRSQPIQYRAINVSHNGDMEPNEPNPIDRREKTGSEAPHDRALMQGHGRDRHTYRIPPGEFPGGGGCKHAGAWRSWRAVR